MAELWDIYDLNRRKTGRKFERGTGHLNPGEYHIVIHICIFNSKGEMLIQRRQPWKHGYPDMWDVTLGGSILEGETSGQGATRELKEELGYDYDFSSMLPQLTVNFPEGFDDYYILQKDIDLSTLTLQYEEVQDVRWATEEEILSMIDEGMFIPFYKSLIHFLFDKKCRYSTTTDA